MQHVSVMPSDNDWRVLRVIIARARDLGGLSGCPKAPDTGELVFRMSLSEIAGAAGVTSATAYKHVRRLVRRGLIRRESRPGPAPATIYMTPSVFHVMEDAIGVLTMWGEQQPPEWGERPSVGRGGFGEDCK